MIYQRHMLVTKSCFVLAWIRCQVPLRPEIHRQSLSSFQKRKQFLNTPLGTHQCELVLLF